MSRLFLIIVVMMISALAPLLARAAEPVVEMPRNQNPMGNYTGQFQKKQFLNKLGGQERLQTYFFRMPAIKDQNTKFPLVLVLHGGAGWAHPAVYLSRGQAPNDYPAFVAVPMLPLGKMWAWPEGDQSYHQHGPLGLTDAIMLAAQLVHEYPIDRSRVYVIGCSDGGTGVFGAVRYFPDIFAGAVSISGTWDPMDAPNMRGVPIWQMYGAQDKVMSPARSKVLSLALHDAKTPIHTVEYQKLGHECDNPVYYQAEMWNWLFKQRRPVQ